MISKSFFYQSLKKSCTTKNSKQNEKASSSQISLKEAGWHGVETFVKKMKQQGPATALPAKINIDVNEIETEVNSMLSDNSAMNPATFLNLLKSKGYQITKQVQAPVEQPKESDMSGGMPQTIFAGKKESEKFNFKCRMQEADLPKVSTVGFTKFKVKLIEEGLGNLHDGFYYPGEVLKNSIKNFEGKKMFADHPGRAEEADRPERSVRDIIGYLENVHYEETDGRGALWSDAICLPGPSYDWARTLMTNTVEFSKKHPDAPFSGMSINADGEAEQVPIDELAKRILIPEQAMNKVLEAKNKGLSIVKLVNNISDAFSVDLVTAPGAGGTVVAMTETNKN